MNHSRATTPVREKTPARDHNAGHASPGAKSPSKHAPVQQRSASFAASAGSGLRSPAKIPPKKKAAARGSKVATVAPTAASKRPKRATKVPARLTDGATVHPAAKKSVTEKPTKKSATKKQARLADVPNAYAHLMADMTDEGKKEYAKFHGHLASAIKSAEAEDREKFRKAGDAKLAAMVEKAKKRESVKKAAAKRTPAKKAAAATPKRATPKKKATPKKAVAKKTGAGVKKAAAKPKANSKRKVVAMSKK